MAPRVYLHTGRLDDFFRLDLRFEKRWRLANGVGLAATFEWFNALLASESTGVQWNPLQGGLIEEERSPLTLPSIGGRSQIQFYGITYHAYQLNVLGWGPDRDLLMLVREYASAALGPSGGFAIDRQPFGDLPVFKLTMEPIDEQIKRLAQQWANKEI